MIKISGPLLHQAGATVLLKVSNTALVKFSGTVNFVELLIQHNTSPVGLSILQRPPVGLGHLGGLGQVRLGLYSTAIISNDFIPIFSVPLNFTSASNTSTSVPIFEAKPRNGPLTIRKPLE